MKSEKGVYHSNFILFLMGRMISDIGTSIQMMTMPLYIIDAGSSASTVGLFSFVSLVPALLVYPLAGVLGDRMNRKAIMVITDFFSAAVILGLAFVSYLDRMSLTVLLIGQMIISLLNGLFDPATRGMLPQLVDQDELTKANAKVASLRGLSVLMGPVIGAVLYGNFGVTILFCINGISFLLSGISEMLIQYKHVHRESAKGISGIGTDLLDGIRFIVSNKVINKLCRFFLVLYAFVQPIFSVVLPLFYKTRLAYSDTQYGYLQSILILGMLFGSVLVGILFGKENNLLKSLRIGCIALIGSMFVFSLLMLPNTVFLLGNDSMLYFILLAAVLSLFSSASMFINVPVQSFIQRETSDEYMSRVFSIVGMITRGGMPFGALIYGIALDRVDAHWIVGGTTLLMTLISTGFVISLSREY